MIGTRTLDRWLTREERRRAILRSTIRAIAIPSIELPGHVVCMARAPVPARARSVIAPRLAL